jgi:hypothetical protein
MRRSCGTLDFPALAAQIVEFTTQTINLSALFVADLRKVAVEHFHALQARQMATGAGAARLRDDARD